MRQDYYRYGGRIIPEYFLGGALKKLVPAAATIATATIPGAGPALAPMAGKLTSQMMNGASEEEAQRRQVNTSSVNQGYKHGGPISYLDQNALAFNGPSHEGGGIQLPNAEVEGGETMDFIEFRQGGVVDKRDGSPYVFSKRLKVPGTNTSFANYHKRLVKNGANEKQVKQLAQVQEEVAGRKQGTATNPPAIPKDQKSKDDRVEKAAGGDSGEDVSVREGESDRKGKEDTSWGDSGYSKADGGKVEAKTEKLIQEGYEPDRAYAIANDMVDDKRSGGEMKPEYPDGGQVHKDPEWWQIGNYQTPLQANRSLNQGNELNSVVNMFDPLSQQQPFKPNGLIVPAGAGQDGRESGLSVTERTPNMFNPLGDEGQDQLGPDDLLRDTGAVAEDIQPVEQTEPQPSQTENNFEAPSAPVGEEGQSDLFNTDTNLPTVEAESEPLQAADVPTNPETGESYGSASEAAGLIGGGSGNDTLTTALQFVPEAMNFLTGAFGDDDVPEPTQVSNRSVRKFPVDVNVNPQLQQNEQSYRAILADPNASVNQKLMAQAQKQQADAQVLGQKINRENQLKSNRARLQSSIDRQNAYYRNQARTEGMKADAMFGPTGNMARDAVGSASQKLLMMQAMQNREERDQQRLEAIKQMMDNPVARNYYNQLGVLEE